MGRPFASRSTRQLALPAEIDQQAGFLDEQIKPIRLELMLHQGVS
jgi:hypothetical protein